MLQNSISNYFRETVSSANDKLVSKDEMKYIILQIRHFQFRLFDKRIAAWPDKNHNKGPYDSLEPSHR